jgi:putative nucleotidyltransferase with HDIG domain
MTPAAWVWHPVRNGIRRQVARWEQRPGPILLLTTGLAAALIGVLVASPRSIRPSYTYAVGDFATATVRAPIDLSIFDDEGTARLRQEASRSEIPVALFDPAPATAVPARISEVFSQARARIAEADAARVVPESELAKLGATARRRLQEARAQEAQHAIESTVPELLAEAERQLAVVLDDNERRVLAAGRFGADLEDGLVALVREAYARPLARDARKLREETERSRRPGQRPRVRLRTAGGASEREMPDVAQLDDVPGAVARLRTRAARLLPRVPAEDRGVLVGLASRLLVPDTVFDEATTARRRAQASANVMPVTVQFRRNQLIVDEGREVTREALLALKVLQQQTVPQTLLLRAAGTAAIAWVMLAGMLWLPARVGLGGVPLRDAVFALTALVGSAAACWGWLSLVEGMSIAAPAVPKTALTLLFPVTAVPMLAGLVLPRRVFIGLCAVIAVCAGSLASLGIVYTAHTFAVGLVAGQLVAPCRQRSCVIRAGAAAGVLAFVTGLCVGVLSGSSVGPGDVLASGAAAALGAVLGGFAPLALSRPIEWVFGYSTKLGLVELLSYDHPLLRRFMERAPGTFQHSVATALLAQAAAEAIGADALLVRVGALYHDVGKMDSPEYYTENQRQPNPREAGEPLDSARVILSHTERGVELLAQYHVGGRIAEFAREHHGTGALASFLHKAEAAGQTPDPADYHYAGPRPQSRETAVMMMADRIEAMARSRGVTTEREFREVVSRTVDDLLAEGQLDEAPLTFRDLARLQPAFVSALTSLYHTRVAYPDRARPVSGLHIARGENRDVVRLRRTSGERANRGHSAADDLRRRH